VHIVAAEELISVPVLRGTDGDGDVWDDVMQEGIRYCEHVVREQGA
jgi:hypothetical protein